jgi:hypothetical protein
MTQLWICWIVFILIVGSIGYELATGTASLRGIGVYSRKQAPGAYWRVIILKGFLAAAIAAIALLYRA